jgi:beta-lactamase class A
MTIKIVYTSKGRPSVRPVPKRLYVPLIVGVLLLCFTHAYASEGDYPLLRESIDPELQAAFEKVLDKKFGKEFWRLVKAKKVGIVVADVTDRHKPIVAEVNGDVMLYAASLPKIAIVLGAFVQIERGEMVLDDPTRELLTATVKKSSNKAATEILNRVGFETLADILQSEKYRLYDRNYGGGLWVGRGYGGGPLWKRDPINNISHGASAMQAARFYYLAVTGRLVAPEYRKDLREIFSKPAIKHKFVKGMKQKKPEAEIYRKSGTWRQFHADSGVIAHEDEVYIIAAIVEHPKGDRGLSELIISVDDLMDNIRANKKGQP